MQKLASLSCSLCAKTSTHVHKRGHACRLFSFDGALALLQSWSVGTRNLITHLSAGSHKLPIWTQVLGSTTTVLLVYFRHRYNVLKYMLTDRKEIKKWPPTYSEAETRGYRWSQMSQTLEKLAESWHQPQWSHVIPAAFSATTVTFNLHIELLGAQLLHELRHPDLFSSPDCCIAMASMNSLTNQLSGAFLENFLLLSGSFDSCLTQVAIWNCMLGGTTAKEWTSSLPTQLSLLWNVENDITDEAANGY